MLVLSASVMVGLVLALATGLCFVGSLDAVVVAVVRAVLVGVGFVVGGWLFCQSVDVVTLGAVAVLAQAAQRARACVASLAAPNCCSCRGIAAPAQLFCWLARRSPSQPDRRGDRAHGEGPRDVREVGRLHAVGPH
eukprot:7941497-Alexandrium_andersonii.AAC.1